MIIFALIMFSLIITLLTGAAAFQIIDNELMGTAKVKHIVFVFIFPVISLIFTCIWWLIRNWNKRL